MIESLLMDSCCLCPRKNSQGCSHKVSLSFTLDHEYARKSVLHPAPLFVVTTLPCDLSQLPKKRINQFRAISSVLLTQSQREAPARANNILRCPPSEHYKLKMRCNYLLKNILRRLPSEADTVRVRSTDPVEIYFDAYRVIQAQSQ